MNFSELGLSDKVLAAVAAAGYTTPTPIQAQAIPIALQGRDIVGIAQTGTGKTASFVLPMLTRLERGRARARMPRSLILEPTRELAAQVAESFATLGAKHKLEVALLIGGVSFDEQFRKLDRGADVLIATPGRLLDHFERGKLLLTGVELLVIDEADRMLDMGFIPDIERICSLLPPRRQTLFFSATMPQEIEKLTNTFLKNPERISVSPPASAAQTITQRLKFTAPDPKSKRAALRELLGAQNIRNAIIFCNRKRDVGILHRSLLRHGFNAGALHGDLSQRERMATLDAFRKGEITLLAASDVAARGLDIPEVSHVFNFDVPLNPEDYVHRIGRTGRAGREGFAAMLVTADDLPGVAAIEALCKIEIPWIGEAPGPEDLEAGKARGGREKGARRGGRRRKTAESQAATSARRTSRSAKAESTTEAGAKGKAGAREERQREVPAEPREAARKPVRAGEPAAAKRRKPRRGERAAAMAEVEPSLAFGQSNQVPDFLMRPIRRSS